jgi:hypothetical protein
MKNLKLFGLIGILVCLQTIEVNCGFRKIEEE